MSPNVARASNTVRICSSNAPLEPASSNAFAADVVAPNVASTGIMDSNGTCEDFAMPRRLRESSLATEIDDGVSSMACCVRAPRVEAHDEISSAVGFGDIATCASP